MDKGGRGVPRPHTGLLDKMLAVIFYTDRVLDDETLSWQKSLESSQDTVSSSWL